MKCIQSFFDLCPSDRIFFILLVVLLLVLGYVIGINRRNKNE